MFPVSKKLYPHCLVLADSRNVFENDLLKQDCLFHSRTQMNYYKLKINVNKKVCSTFILNIQV